MDAVDSLAFRIFVVVLCGGLGVMTLTFLVIAIALWRRNLHTSSDRHAG